MNEVFHDLGTKIQRRFSGEETIGSHVDDGHRQVEAETVRGKEVTDTRIGLQLRGRSTGRCEAPLGDPPK